ncbi:HU family DNA-binding protein [Nostoc sp. LEGE 12447]|nr:HU family DNA-binding protein [Nostoc sp. LEGE 12447]MBE9002066.1 HU family DNA-binding protein [Nostoc sp. LEGE 12447]
MWITIANGRKSELRIDWSVVTETVANGEKVTLIGFGSLERRERSEREGRNPKTNEPMTIPATRVPAFSAGKQFREKVAQ